MKKLAWAEGGHRYTVYVDAWAPVFLDSWNDKGSGPLDAGALEQALAGALQLARAAWPGLSVASHRFVSHLASCIAAAPDPAAALAGLYAADLYLACACLDDNTAALTVFEGAYLVELGVLRRIDSSPAFVDEVRQRLRVHLFVGELPKIADYAGRGPLKSWVRAVALRLGLMMVRGVQREVPDEDGRAAAALVGSSNPELNIIKNHYREAFADAVRRAVRGLDQRDRTVLRMHVIDGLNIDKIGVLFKVHRATIATWIASARKTVLAVTHRELSSTLGIPTGDLQSLMGLMVSQLDVSLHGLLL